MVGPPAVEEDPTAIPEVVIKESEKVRESMLKDLRTAPDLGFDVQLGRAAAGLKRMAAAEAAEGEEKARIKAEAEAKLKAEKEAAEEAGRQASLEKRRRLKEEADAVERAALERAEADREAEVRAAEEERLAEERAAD